jgi:hypothetical protein
VSDSIFFLLGDDGKVLEAPSTAFAAEAVLQKILADNLHLLPGAQINPDEPRRWALIQREAGVPDRDGGGAWWALDHLAVDQDAVPTFIEVKRASDTRARREVVAQMLDYAANGSLFWTAEQLRSWFEGDDADGAAGRLAELLRISDEEDSEQVAAAFWDAVGTNLREGHVRLVFVADRIPASLKRLVEFMNEQMPRVEVLAVEIRQYAATGGQTALVPRLIGDTARAQAAKEAPASRGRRAARWTVDDVLEIAAAQGPEVAVVAQAIAAWAQSHPYIEIRGGVGQHDPSFTMHADTGLAPLSSSGVLSLWTKSQDKTFLEVRIRQMVNFRPDARVELTAVLRSLDVPEKAIAKERPGIALADLTEGRVQQLLTVMDQWIENARRSAGLSPAL